MRICAVRTRSGYCHMYSIPRDARRLPLLVEWLQRVYAESHEEQTDRAQMTIMRQTAEKESAGLLVKQLQKA